MANKRLVESKVLSCVSGNCFMMDKAKIGLAKMNNNCKILIPLDGCEIRKQWTRKSEMLDRVRDLDGKTINGYHSYCTIAVREDNHGIHLLEHKIYSTKTEDFLSKNDETMKIIDSTLEGLKDVSNQKIFIFDREFDNFKIINHLKNHKQKPSFVIRASHLNRGVEILEEVQEGFEEGVQKGFEEGTEIEEKTKTYKPKIQDLKFNKKNQTTIQIQKLQIKQKTHFDLTLKLSWEDVIMINSKGEKTTVKVIKSKLTDRKGQPIFKSKKDKESNQETDFYLLTNQEINNSQDAYQIYLSYFIRWKIETVFKFLKDSLGLEEFRVEKYEAIKNVITLTFLIGAYLMELGDISVDDEFLISIAKLGRGKGAVTKYYITQGLQELTHYLQVQDYFEKHKIPPQQQKEMLDYVRRRNV
jgi:hypothetical protein